MPKGSLQRFGAMFLAVVLQIVLIGTSLGQDLPQTFDDESVSNATGQSVTVKVLNNDEGDWIPETVRLIAPNGLSQQTEYVEPDQGIWTVNFGDPEPNPGWVTFVPCSDVGIPDIRCISALKGDPFPVDYVVEDGAGVVSNPAQISIAYSDGPLAITVSYFRSAQGTDGKVEFVWATISESDNAGFYLLAEGPDGLHLLNDELIPSGVINSVSPQMYEYVVATTATSFFLQEVSLSGPKQALGPYELGQSYGDLPSGLSDSTDRANYIYLPTVFAGP